MSKIWTETKTFFGRLRDFILTLVYLASSLLVLMFIIAFYVINSIFYRPAYKRKL